VSASLCENAVFRNPIETTRRRILFILLIILLQRIALEGKRASFQCQNIVILFVQQERCHHRIPTFCNPYINRVVLP
jgi:hypothetical protein